MFGVSSLVQVCMSKCFTRRWFDSMQVWLFTCLHLQRFYPWARFVRECQGTWITLRPERWYVTDLHYLMCKCLNQVVFAVLCYRCFKSFKKSAGRLHVSTDQVLLYRKFMSLQYLYIVKKFFLMKSLICNYRPFHRIPDTGICLFICLAGGY